MDGRTFSIKSQRVVLPEGIRPATVAVTDGVISGVSADDGPPADHDLAEAVIMPGLVDTHVHVNEPGRTDWEGFSTATAAAAAGGTTTIIDMPLNSIPPTTEPEALELKRQAASGSSWVDVGFWGGLVPDNAAELRNLAAEGVFGFKCFLVESGVPEFPPVSLAQLARAAELVPEGLPFLVHAEDPAIIAAADEAFRALPAEARRSYAAYLGSRPAQAELVASRGLASFALQTGARTHVLHVSAAAALEPLNDARASGARITTETCPHYLTFEAEEIPDGATLYKCSPPIRDAINRSALWAGLHEGSVDCVVSDHSPCTPDLKALDSGDFSRAWGGISSVQLRLSTVWTEARERGHKIEELSRWLSGAPARLAGLDSKGRIATGADADLVVWDPDADFHVEEIDLLDRHRATPYAGRSLYGTVLKTFVRGRQVWDGSTVLGRPSGSLLERAG